MRTTTPTQHAARTILTALVVACGGDKDETDTGFVDTDTGRPTGDGYAFDSRFSPGTSSVVHDGQTLRHLLIEDLEGHLGALTARIDAGFFPAAGEIAAELDFYFSFDSATSGSVPIGKQTTPAPLQTVYDDVSSDKDLVSKIAGNDAEGQHVDWSVAFVGWDEAGVTTPESLVRRWFSQIDEAAVARSNGDIPLGPDGAPLSDVSLTADGHDRRQLLEKFLTGAVAFSQGADDYLDDDLPGKGLLSPNTQDGDDPYTVLEHQWDEGFGYFGAARDYGDWTDELLAGDAVSDTWTPDGAIDLLTEVSWGHATNAGKRDDGAIAATDLTADAWAGFLDGRRLIAETDGELSAAQLDQLRGHRDRAVGAWEQAIAATVVHYVNDTLRDMGKFGTADYLYADHAKHWSELKGFALSLQFNPRSPLSDADFQDLHDAIGMRPALPGDPDPQIEAYRASLLEARALVGDRYSFDPANLGDDDGQNGW